MAEHNNGDSFCFNRSFFMVVLVLVLIGIGLWIGRAANTQKVTTKSEAAVPSGCTKENIYQNSGSGCMWCSPSGKKYKAKDATYCPYVSDDNQGSGAISNSFTSGRCEFEGKTYFIGQKVWGPLKADGTHSCYHFDSWKVESPIEGWGICNPTQVADVDCCDFTRGVPAADTRCCYPTTTPVPGETYYGLQPNPTAAQALKNQAVIQPGLCGIYPNVNEKSGIPCQIGKYIAIYNACYYMDERRNFYNSGSSSECGFSYESPDDGHYLTLSDCAMNNAIMVRIVPGRGLTGAIINDNWPYCRANYKLKNKVNGVYKGCYVYTGEISPISGTEHTNISGEDSNWVIAINKDNDGSESYNCLADYYSSSQMSESKCVNN